MNIALVFPGIMHSTDTIDYSLFLILQKTMCHSKGATWYSGSCEHACCLILHNYSGYFTPFQGIVSWLGQRSKLATIVYMWKTQSAAILGRGV